MKKLAIVFLCFVLFAGFMTSCAKQEPAQPTAEQSTPAQQDTTTSTDNVSDATPAQ